MTQPMHTPGPWDRDLGDYGTELPGPERWATVALVACSAKKQDKGTTAAYLYTSTWFKLARSWARERAGLWYILSAKHGLVKPFHWLAPYDERLPGGKPENRREWAEDVAELVDLWLGAGWGLHPENVEIVMLAGKDYCTPLAEILEGRGYAVSRPLAGMGIGVQQRWLKEHS